MKLLHLAAWISGAALLGAGATLLRAQPSPPPPPDDAPAVRIDKNTLRAEIVKMRTEIEMLRFDYELARDRLLEDLKGIVQLRIAAGFLQSIPAPQTSGDDAEKKPAGAASAPESDQDRKKGEAAAKAAEEEEKKADAEVKAFIADRKNELARLFKSLSEKRLDLEDAERAYRATSP